MSGTTTVVIIGAGLAGAKAAEGLRKEGFDGRVVMFGAESHPPYLRPPLTKDYLRGEATFEASRIHPPAWYADQSVELDVSSTVRAIDLSSREVEVGDGARLGFDRLLIATGAAPRHLAVTGGHLGGIHYLRTIEDADAIREAAARARRAVVIGGGWIGSEAAASLRQLGLPVVLVTAGKMPLERVLGAEVGAVYRDLHLAHGVEIAAGERVTEFRGVDRVAEVRTVAGTRIEGDLVVVGVGAEPRTRLAAAAGLEVDDGIVVDQHLETSVPGVFAAGDVAAAWHPLLGARVRIEHWDNARRQGRAAARNMLGRAEPYERIPYFYSDQYDLGMEYAGFAPEWDRVIFRREPEGRGFVAFWLRDGRVAAGMNVDVWDVNVAISALVASRQPVDVDRLGDPAVPLDDLDALRAHADAVGR